MRDQFGKGQNEAIKIEEQVVIRGGVRTGSDQGSKGLR